LTSKSVPNNALERTAGSHSLAAARTGADRWLAFARRGRSLRALDLTNSTGLTMSLEPNEQRRPSVAEELQILAGSELRAGPERGLRRLTLLVSAIAFLIGAVLGLLWLPEPPNELRLGPLPPRLSLTILVSLGAGAVPWGVFFAIRWVVRGFHD